MPAIVFYMALSHLEEISKRLIAAGRPPNEPVALIERATMPDERVTETVLVRAAKDAAKHSIETPVIVAIGTTVSLRTAIMQNHGTREVDA